MQTIKIENYNEVDWFDFELRMRNLIHQLLQPHIKASIEDRTSLKRVQYLLGDYESRVSDLEFSVLNKKGDSKESVFD